MKSLIDASAIHHARLSVEAALKAVQLGNLMKLGRARFDWIAFVTEVDERWSLRNYLFDEASVMLVVALQVECMGFSTTPLAY